MNEPFSLSMEALQALFSDVAAGNLNPAQAIDRLGRLPFENSRFSTLDHHRAVRQGFPETVLCEPKTPQQAAEAFAALAASHPRVIATRAQPNHIAAIVALVPDAHVDELARVVWVDRNRAARLSPGVVLVCAGTSDLPVAQEAARTLEVCGFAPELICDVGVAGLHRLLAQMERLQHARVIIVVAGMDGALPSVVAGLVAAPVIAVPTSVGYGVSRGGFAALAAALSSCSPGVASVNIDNGFGAAQLAARMLLSARRADDRDRERAAHELSPALARKLTRLREVIRARGEMHVAYSGGVDSALVAAVAAQELGDRALACIGLSPSYPRGEFRAAIALLRNRGIRYRLLRTYEHRSKEYAANPAERCYYCKQELYGRLRAVLGSQAVIADGTQTDDLGDTRPGRRAAADARVVSPLVEAELGKSEIRALARALGIPVWDKPAAACLSSRVPTGSAITPQKLRTVEEAEAALQRLGFGEVRVRHHGDIARIQLPPEKLGGALAERGRILGALREAGYRHGTIDLAALHEERHTLRIIEQS